MSDQIYNHNQNTSNYLDDPSIVDKFTKKYLSNINLYLNDKNYKDKISMLPELKSATTLKFEKIVEKKNEILKNKINKRILNRANYKLTSSNTKNRIF